MYQTLATFALPDGREVRIRRPHEEADLDRLMDFFTSLPPTNLRMLRFDVKNRENVQRRLRQVDERDRWRLCAELEGRFVATATMDRDPFGWTRHIAHLRVVSAPEFLGLGVRQILCEHLVKLARTAGVERLFTEVLPEDRAYIEFLESLGFTREIVRHDYAKGVDGQLHDLLVLSNDLESVWRHLEDSLHLMDMNFSRLSGKY